MKTLKVPDMHCPKCVERIKNGLSAEGIACEISLDEKTVAVDESRETAAVAVLDDLGFEAK